MSSFNNDSHQEKRVVDCDSVGVRSKANDGYETLVFILHNFEKLENIIKSRPLKAHGCRWQIICDPDDFPDDYNPGDDYDPGVGIYLSSLENFDVKVSCIFRCRTTQKDMNHTFKKSYTHEIGYNLIRKSEIQSHLEHDGSLEIAVDIKMVDKIPTKNVWYPKKLQRQDILVDLYEDASSKTADVTFSVKGKEYRAHKNILALRCKKLFEIANLGSDDNAPIPIFIDREELFRWLLEFVYTVELPKLKDAKDAMDLLVVADCYECVPLKLYIESVIVDRLIKPANAAELFLFADRYSCALLREKAIAIFVDDAATVKKAKAWSEITESKEFVLEFNDALTSEDYHRRTDVTTLREQLEEAKLPLDGSRKILQARWKDFSQSAANKAKENANTSLNWNQIFDHLLNPSPMR